MQKKSQLENELSGIEELEDAKSNMEEWLELAEEDQSSEILQVAEEQIRHFKKVLDSFELKTLLSSEHDKNNAILEIHQVQVALKHRTGQRCYSGCTKGGLKIRVIKLKSWIYFLEMKQV